MPYNLSIEATLVLAFVVVLLVANVAAQLRSYR